MAVTLRTRKPIDSLSLKDLDAYPIWEFCIDEEGVEGQDETWVRPVKAKSIPRNQYSLNVSADLTAANGDGFRGFVGVTTIKGKVEISGGVILNGPKPYLFIPNPEFFLYKKESQQLAANLGIHRSKLFPISYSLRVLVTGEKIQRTGKLPCP
jgi:hypothetical protein